MKLITRDIGYAVTVLCVIAEQKRRRISVSELAKKLNIPKHFLRKIMQVLNKKGVLRSYKGRGGGFVLAQAPRKILLINLIEIFQGPVKLSECIFKKTICPNIQRCKLKKKIDVIGKYVISKLKNITLASLLEKERK